MVSQATINGQPRIDEAAAQVSEGVANLATELITLTELQARLAVLDLQESGSLAIKPISLLSGGAGLALGTIPIILLGFTWLLDRMTSLTLDGAAFVVALISLVISGICIGVGYSHTKQAFCVLNRSREEFRANLQWIKKAIQQSTSFRR